MRTAAITVLARPATGPSSRSSPGRVALVTGGPCEASAAIYHRLAAQGARIADLPEGNPGRAADAREVLRTVLDQHGRLDILVNFPTPGASGMAQAAFEHMIKRGTGRIINISPSSVGPGQPGQGETETGLAELTRSLANQAIQRLNQAPLPVSSDIGLTVNMVTGGSMVTDGSGAAGDGPAADKEIAAAVGFLAGDQAAFITGQIWDADGAIDS